MRFLWQIRRLIGRASTENRPDVFLRALQAEIPAARRIGAVGLGRLGDKAHRALLWEQLERERCATVRAAIGLALFQHGVGKEELHRTSPMPVRLRTMSGFRSIEGESMPSFDGIVSLGPEVLRERVDQEPGKGAESLWALSRYQHPEDLQRVERVRHAGGRRAEHLCLEALGWLGQPESLPVLKAALREYDVDPGRGFARRRIAAVALGRMGLPSAWRALSSSLSLEAGEHEGRPGAGMGLQFPVRAAILWGLGELQVQRAAPLLCAQLDRISDSALGGLHLPAMEALWKLGSLAENDLNRALESPVPLVALHAACVLEGLGKPEALQRLAEGDGAAAEEARRALLHQ